METMNPIIEKYIGGHTSPEDKVLERLCRETYLKVLNPRMLSGHVQGRFLEMMSKMIQPERILEIGTFTGYSAICLAKGLAKNGKLHTIEVNEELKEMANRYFREAGVEWKIIQHTGDALELIPAINETFDLVFIDAAKDYYLNYYHLIFNKVKKGGFILADNALWEGKVVDQSIDPEKDTRGIMDFNDFVQKDDRVENVLLPLRDGIMVIRKL
jgi:predicted O-methyltransferase YrrM